MDAGFNSTRTSDIKSCLLHENVKSAVLLFVLQMPPPQFAFRLVIAQMLTNPRTDSICFPVSASPSPQTAHAHDKWSPKTINNMKYFSPTWIVSSPFSRCFFFFCLPRVRCVERVPSCVVDRRSVPRMPSAESHAEDNPYDFRHLLRKTSQRRKLIKQYWTQRWTFERFGYIIWSTVHTMWQCVLLYDEGGFDHIFFKNLEKAPTALRVTSLKYLNAALTGWR